MQRSIWANLGGWTAALGLILATAASAWAVDPGERPRIQIGLVEVAAEAEPLKPGDYWIGLACAAAGEALRAQLGLEEKQGLVVENVVPESPAAKAGVEVNDVLVSAGDQLLLKVQDLMGAVDRAKENTLTLEFYRAGKRKKIDVTPAKRPDEAAMPKPSSKASDYHDAIRSYFDQLRPGEGGTPPLRFRYFHPGAVLPQGSRAMSMSLPGDMSVAVTKRGDEPAQVKVQKGDQKWEVTADKLDELPDEVREPVERLLGRVGRTPGTEGESSVLDFDFIPDWAWRGVPPDGEEAPKLHQQNPMEKQIEELRKRVESMMEKQEDARKQMEQQFQQRFDELRKRLEELRENRPRPRDSEKDKSGEKPRQGV
jgi:hypothetical protein